MYRIIHVFLVLCLCSFVFVNSQHDHNHKVNVAVYYESLCNDSIKFITKQLYPALDKPELSKHVNLTLVPYGKTITTSEANKGLTFSCHHGPGECRGNILHACALANISSNGGAINLVALDFISCLLEKVVNKEDATEFPVNNCAASAKVTNVADITNCANSVGSGLLEIQGQLTAAVQKKPLTSVPTIVFDNKYDPVESSNAEKNFIKTLCAHIKHDQPAECKNQNGGQIQNKPIGIALALLVVALKLF